MANTCMHIESKRIDDGVQIITERLEIKFSLITERIDESLNVVSSVKSDTLKGLSCRKDVPLSICSQVVCSSEGYYLKIEPEVIWLTPKNNFNEDVLVKANTNWTIE